jgi:hypothetical protein
VPKGGDSFVGSQPHRPLQVGLLLERQLDYSTHNPISVCAARLHQDDVPFSP